MASSRIYAVEDTKANTITLVQASNPAQARGHCARAQYKASVATQQQIVRLMSAGATVQTAGEEPDEPEVPAEVITGKK